jgi:CDGSH-type Zn-finger protein
VRPSIQVDPTAVYAARPIIYGKRSEDIAMAEVRIRTLKDGPYEVKGAIQLIDANRADFSLKEDPIYLCRCGHSASKPFCDGSHKRMAFKAEEPAR